MAIKIKVVVVVELDVIISHKNWKRQEKFTSAPSKRWSWPEWRSSANIKWAAAKPTTETASTTGATNEPTATATTESWCPPIITFITIVMLCTQSHASDVSFHSFKWNQSQDLPLLLSFHYNVLYYIHMFNGPFSRTTSGSRHQKGKPFWILLKQEMIFYGPDGLPDAQPTVTKHWRHSTKNVQMTNKAKKEKV